MHHQARFSLVCKVTVASFALSLCFAMNASSQSPKDELKSGFENPPQSARPRVWWHWMNGNITQDGIRLDLEWMHRVGVAGYTAFDGSLLTPVVVDKRLVYMTPDWKSAFKYATTLSDQLGLEEAIASSPGWSETGGPWVKAQEGMKKYVWSETRVEGGTPFTGILAHPPSNTGAFQNIGIEDMGSMGGPTFHAPQFYADSAVVAYKVPVSDISIDSLHPTITSSGGPIDEAILEDGDLVKSISLPLNKTVGEKAWIQYEFDQPETIQAMTIVIPGRGLFGGMFSSGGDSGRAWKRATMGKTIAWSRPFPPSDPRSIPFPLLR